ncbi:MAG: thiolase family protein [Phycisphaeraceae bacterium]|nr:thiolase family protein [Phycisphaeraceae bacterium]
MKSPVIIAARRTAIGRFMGRLSRVPSPVLGSLVASAVLDEVGGDVRARVDECIMGCVLQAGLGQNPARQAGLKANLPETLNAMTVNKVCGSGLQAVMLAAQSIRAGVNRLVLCGGFENMSLAPHLVHARAGIKYGPGTLVDHMQFDGLTCPFEGWAMGNAADHIAQSHGISRREQDRFAAQSHQRAHAATAQGFFRDEILPLTGAQIGDRKNPGAEGGLSQDEGVRPDSTAEGLAGLPPAFQKEGTVTAGNASQISDGAAALLVADEAMASELGRPVLARLIDMHTAGVAPRDIFHAPALGVRAILDRNRLSVDDIDLFEINEAFAAQVLANRKVLDIPEDRLNVCGGSIAIGHPIGASGARVFTTLLHQLRRTGGRRGIASLCLGGGNAVTVLVERGD